MKVQLHLSNYEIKADLKNKTGTDASSFAKKTDWASLKSNVGNKILIKQKIFQLI